MNEAGIWNVGEIVSPLDPRKRAQFRGRLGLAVKMRCTDDARCEGAELLNDQVSPLWPGTPKGDVGFPPREVGVANAGIEADLDPGKVGSKLADPRERESDRRVLVAP